MLVRPNFRCEVSTAGFVDVDTVTFCAAVDVWLLSFISDDDGLGTLVTAWVTVCCGFSAEGVANEMDVGARELGFEVARDEFGIDGLDGIVSSRIVVTAELDGIVRLLRR